nr:MAG TPA: hypothetical protein [Caudoviricetes sp.]
MIRAILFIVFSFLVFYVRSIMNGFIAKTLDFF